MRQGLLALGLLLVLPLAAQGAQGGQALVSARQLAEYREVVDAYRAGRHDAALERLLAADHPALAALVSGLIKRASLGVGRDPWLDRAFYQAASLLHAAAALDRWRNVEDERASAHLGLARGLVDAAAGADSRSEAFRRRWYLATSLLLVQVLSPDAAARAFDVALRRVPRDAPLLVAAGWFHERLADGNASAGWSLRTAQAMRRNEHTLASRRFEAALAIDPGSAEAALRLARVDAAMGRDARAVSRLTALLAREDLDTFTAYVGRLVLGDVHERHGRTADAERCFREAVEIDPSARSARLALGQLRYAAGEADAAADLVAPVLHARSHGQDNDPWVNYRLAYPLIGRLVFDELAAEVRR